MGGEWALYMQLAGCDFKEKGKCPLLPFSCWWQGSWGYQSVAAVTLLDNGVADLRVSEQQDGKGLGLQHYGCAVSTLDL